MPIKKFIQSIDKDNLLNIVWNVKYWWWHMLIGTGHDIQHTYTGRCVTNFGHQWSLESLNDPNSLIVSHSESDVSLRATFNLDVNAA